VAETKTYENGGRRYKHIIPEEIKPTNLINIITYDLLIQKLSIKKEDQKFMLIIQIIPKLRSFNAVTSERCSVPHKV